MVKPGHALAEPPSLVRHLMRHILAGMLFVLPVVITVAVLYQLCLILDAWVVQPIAVLVIPSTLESEYWTAIERYITPILSLTIVVVFLYLMGYAGHFGLARAVDWSISKVPGVSTLYAAIRDVFLALEGPDGLRKVDTVVLVPFPHSSARMAGYLTGVTRNEEGTELACVYVPIALFPPSGYTLILPKKEITVTDWPAPETWKLLLSGGLTVPPRLPYP